MMPPNTGDGFGTSGIRLQPPNTGEGLAGIRILPPNTGDAGLLEALCIEE
jgi:hypothetical protein